MSSVFINGMGLIGASIAKIIRIKDPSIRIIASDPNTKNIQLMINQNIVDSAVDFQTGAEQADVIFLSTPVDVIVQSLDQLATFKLKKNVIVTDVGSNKEKILQAAKPLMDNDVSFIGGHPMAGSHHSGSQFSSIKMLDHHTYFLIKGNASEHDIHQIEKLLAPAHFQFKKMTANQHDQLVSATSHLPHLIAFALINTIDPEVKAMKIDPGIPSGGLLDSTRIAQADPEMWTSIMTSEDHDLLQQIDLFQTELNRLKSAIQNHDRNAIEKQIQHANDARRELEDLR